jgi:uncharacterized integral membrane protein
MKRYVGYALLAIVFIFTLQNYRSVEIRFLFWSLDMSASILIFLVLVVGVLVGWLLRFRGRKTAD